MKKRLLSITVNSRHYEIAVDPTATLLQVLREELNLTGTKMGCGEGDCGACTVLLEGQAVNACLVLALQAHQHQVTTIEGLAQGQELHPIQQAFVDHGAIQCGFCSPGMILSAKQLLDTTPDPTQHQIRQGISGNLCRCTGYQKIVEAISDAAGRLASTKARKEPS